MAKRTGRHELNERQVRFCAEYIIDLNATQAAMRAGYSPTTAKLTGHRLLVREDVQAEIAVQLSERAERTKVTSDAVVLLLWKMCSTPITAFSSWTKEKMDLRPSAEIPAWAVHAIQEVSRGSDGTIKVKLREIGSLMGLLARHTGAVPTPGSKAAPVVVDLNVTDKRDLSEYSLEQLEELYDLTGTLVEALGITDSAARTEEPTP